MTLPGPVPGDDPLARVALSIRARFPALTTIEPEELAARIDGGVPLLVLDVRTRAEHATGRIDGSVRCELGHAGLQQVAALAAGGHLAGRMVVVVCAVGWRSACLADAAGCVVRAAGAAALHNLEGGVIRWHNERRPLVDDRGATAKVHGYSRRWARYVLRQGDVVLGSAAAT